MPITGCGSHPRGSNFVKVIFLEFFGKIGQGYSGKSEGRGGGKGRGEAKST